MPATGTRFIASISGSMMGDEWTESWLLCPRCNVYSVEVCCEPFLGDETISVRGPVPKEEGDAQIALIRKCSEPWNKKCRCPAHLKYFDGQLD
jgi:hypothetical protein